MTMKKLTEKEMLRKQSLNLNYCSLLEKDGIISISDISELIPGYIHLNNRETIGMEYISTNGLENFQRSLEEIQFMGRDFVNEVTDNKTQYIISTSLVDFSKNGSENATFNFIQRVRYSKKDDFSIFYTVTKKYRNKTSLLSYTQPINKLNGGSYLKEIVDDRYKFFNNNYYKFIQLSKREKEIISLIIHGNNNKQIAEKLFISYHTVKTHRKNIFRKLETSNLLFLGDFYKVFLQNQ